MKTPLNKQSPNTRSNKQNNTSQSLQKQEKKPAKLNIIDSIFKATKQQKIQKRKQAEANKTIQQIAEQKRIQKEKKIQDKLKKQWRIEEKLRKLNDGEVPTTKKTESGVKIYTQEELNIGKGGNTPKCPIDCQCCF